MISPEDTSDEQTRLRELLSYDIIDSEAEEDFDNLTKLASEICGTKISLISLLDDKRQWFKSKVGLETNETPKELSFCGHAIHNPNEIFIVKNARKDKRFYNNPLVTHAPYISFYAGVPLLSSNGQALGTLCVIDDRPKSLSGSQLRSLKTLTKQIMNLIELRKKKKELEAINHTITRKNQEIERFAYLAAHDLKSPLNSSAMVIESLLLNPAITENQEAKLLLEMIGRSSERLKNLIDGLLEFSKIDKITSLQLREIKAGDLIYELKLILPIEDEYRLEFDSQVEQLRINSPAIISILHNLIVNSIKYSDKPEPFVRLSISEDEQSYHFAMQDNGPGIPSEHLEDIFEPFSTLDIQDKYGKRGTGLGLAYVKKMVEKMEGHIKLKSELGQGVTYQFHVKKYYAFAS